MQKNVSGQKLIVFAFDSTTNLPKTGDAANITAYESLDWGTVTVLGDTSATEMDATNAKGYYLFDLTQAETNANIIHFSAKSSTSNIVVIAVPAVVQTVPAAFTLAGGASGGFLISGSNSGTTTLAALTVTGATTLTGNVALADGLTIAAPSTANRAGITITGNGSGAGIISTGGSTGNGVSIVGGASGHGLSCAGTGTTKHGIHATGGSTTSHGINAVGGGVGHGILATSGSGSTGDGIRATAASTNGNGLNLLGVGTGTGLLATGGATGHGFSGVGGATSGNGMRLAGTAGNSIAFNILGQGSAAGMSCTGGATGAGASFVGGATSGNAISTSVTSGNLYINANVTHYNGTAGTFASGRPEVNTTHWGGTAVASALVRSNLIEVGGSATPVTNMTTVFDTDFATNYDTTNDMWLVNLQLMKGEAFTYSGAFDFDGLKLAYETVNTNLDAAITSRSSHSASDVWAVATRVLTAATNISGPIADQVWLEPLADHSGSSGSTAEALNAAGSAGDPWTTTLPGSYTGSQAGFIIGTIRAAQLNVLSPHVAEDSSTEIVIGDDYYAADNRNLSFLFGASPSLSGATVTLEIQIDTTAEDSDDNYTSTTGSVSGSTSQTVTFDLPGTTTEDLTEGWHAYRVKAVLSNDHTVTLLRGRMNLLARGDDAP